jgi:hypothetical protein
MLYARMLIRCRCYYYYYFICEIYIVFAEDMLQFQARDALKILWKQTVNALFASSVRTTRGTRLPIYPPYFLVPRSISPSPNTNFLRVRSSNITKTSCFSKLICSLLLLC